MRHPTWQYLVVLATFGLVITWRAAPAAQGQSPDVLTALLLEVRGLRAAMEQMASAGPRIQLAMGRLQLQEQRINTLMRRIESTRETLATAQAELAAKQERLAHFETLTAADRADRDEIVQVITTLKREIASGALTVQRLQADESASAQDLASEQGRWNDINQRLDELDRALTRR